MPSFVCFTVLYPSLWEAAADSTCVRLNATVAAGQYTWSRRSEASVFLPGFRCVSLTECCHLLSESVVSVYCVISPQRFQFSLLCAPDLVFVCPLPFHLPRCRDRVIAIAVCAFQIELPVCPCILHLPRCRDRVVAAVCCVRLFQVCQLPARYSCLLPWGSGPGGFLHGLCIVSRLVFCLLFTGVHLARRSESVVLYIVASVDTTFQVVRSVVSVGILLVSLSLLSAYYLCVLSCSDHCYL